MLHAAACAPMPRPSLASRSAGRSGAPQAFTILALAFTSACGIASNKALAHFAVAFVRHAASAGLV